MWIYNFLWSGFYALIPFIFIVLLVGTYNFTEVDFINYRYREGTSILGKKNGDWKKIRAFNYVSIVGKQYRSNHLKTVGFTSLKTGTSEGFGVYEIRLFKTISQRIILFNFSSHKKAIKVGKILAIGLNSKLLDATIKPQKFIQL